MADDTDPRTSMASFTARGRPHKGVMSEPLAALASIAAASCRACRNVRPIMIIAGGTSRCRARKHDSNAKAGYQPTDCYVGKYTFVTLYVIQGLLHEYPPLAYRWFSAVTYCTAVMLRAHNMSTASTAVKSGRLLVGPVSTASLSVCNSSRPRTPANREFVRHDGACNTG